MDSQTVREVRHLKQVSGLTPRCWQFPGECLCLFLLPEAAPSLDSLPSFISKPATASSPPRLLLPHLLLWLSCFPSFASKDLCDDLETSWIVRMISPSPDPLITSAKSPLPWEVLYLHVPGIGTWARKLWPRICLYCRGQPAPTPAGFSLLCPVHTTSPPDIGCQYTERYPWPLEPSVLPFRCG